MLRGVEVRRVVFELYHLDRGRFVRSTSGAYVEDALLCAPDAEACPSGRSYGAL